MGDRHSHVIILITLVVHDSSATVVRFVNALDTRIPSHSAVITASKKPGHKGLCPSLNAEPL